MACTRPATIWPSPSTSSTSYSTPSSCSGGAECPEVLCTNQAVYQFWHCLCWEYNHSLGAFLNSNLLRLSSAITSSRKPFLIGAISPTLLTLSYISLTTKGYTRLYHYVLYKVSKLLMYLSQPRVCELPDGKVCYSLWDLQNLVWTNKQATQ